MNATLVRSRAGASPYTFGSMPSLRTFSLNAWTIDSSALSRLKNVTVSDSDVQSPLSSQCGVYGGM